MNKTAAICGIISDANVLIDYAKSAPNILKLLSANLAQVYVAVPILREVDQLNEDDIKKLGITTIEATLDQLVEANKLHDKKPALSWQDTLCYVLARDNGWTCLTTDKLLRRFCLGNGVSCLWQFEIMIMLVSVGKLTPEKAYKVAQDIRSKNKYIKVETIEKFRNKLGL